MLPKSDNGHLLFDACLNVFKVPGNRDVSDDPECGTESSTSSESSGQCTRNSPWDKDEQLNEDVMYTNAKHTAMMDQYDTCRQLRSQVGSSARIP